MSTTAPWFLIRIETTPSETVHRSLPTLRTSPPSKNQGWKFLLAGATPGVLDTEREKRVVRDDGS